MVSIPENRIEKVLDLSSMKHLITMDLYDNRLGTVSYDVQTVEYVDLECNYLDTGELGMQIHRYIGKCKEYPDTAIEVTDMRIERNNRETFLTHTWNVKRTVDHIDKLTMMATKCANADGGDYCESFRDISLRHFDTLLTNPLSPWSRMFVYNPPLSFPLKPGKYVARQQRVDNSIAVFSMSGYWKVKAVGFMPNGKPIMCVQAEGSVP
nr:unnamed protein product [Callosobruchus chinensis]